MGKVLVIDDSQTVRAAVERELAKDGHTVVSLRAFTELPTCLARFQPDLVILDLEMPALSGVAFASFLRRYESRQTPILVYSGKQADELHQAVSQIGAVGSVSKSQPYETLRSQVRRALSG